jgi:hypothetical protein
LGGLVSPGWRPPDFQAGEPDPLLIAILGFAQPDHPYRLSDSNWRKIHFGVSTAKLSPRVVVLTLTEIEQVQQASAHSQETPDCAHIERRGPWNPLLLPVRHLNNWFSSILDRYLLSRERNDRLGI